MFEISPRIGVFICRCGRNIADIINLDVVKSEIEKIKDVACVETNTFMCSLPGQSLLSSKILELTLNRIVIAACSLKVHKRMFENVLENARLNPYLFEIANIREQCSWVHQADPKAATHKAISLIRGAIFKARYLHGLENIKQAVKKNVLVVGGGIAGISASLSLAKSGYDVYLIERDFSIGGNMVKLVKTYPEEECAMCTISPLMTEVAQHPNITLDTGSELKDWKGSVGNFSVVVKHNPRFVDLSKCTACGDCTSVCPVTIPDEWNYNLGTKKAIYRSFPEAVPNAFIIDPSQCLYLKSSNNSSQVCQKCVEACSANAINLEEKATEKKFDVGSIIVTTGHEDYDPSVKPQLGYVRYEDVITIMQCARLLDINGPTRGKFRRPSDNKIPKQVIFLQCVGSRDEKPSGHSYCSKVCCMSALKYASMIKKSGQNIDVTISYTDIRATGFNEDYYRYVQDLGVRFIRGKVSEVYKENDDLFVRLEDTLSGDILELKSDLVVLSTALEPSIGTVEISKSLGLLTDQHDFIQEEHLKLRPINTSVRGIFAAGTALGPKDITESVSQASGAASKVEEILKKGTIEIPPEIAFINPEKCNNCGLCISACPYQAVEKLNNRIMVQPLVCVGCGACVPECPEDALDLYHLTERQFLAQIDGICAEKTDSPFIIALLESSITYNAADNAGIKKIQYPTNARIIRVPSTAYIKFKHILYAFEKGVSGIILGEGPEEGPYGKVIPIMEERIKIYEEKLEEKGIDPIKLWFVKIYINQGEKLVDLFKTFTETLDEE